MSRAFTKERDDAPLPEPTLKRTSPLVLTPQSLERRRALVLAEPDLTTRAAGEAELREATIVEPPADLGIVAPGATVTIRGAAKNDLTFEVVTEDDVDVERARIGGESPLGRALLGKRAGDEAVWRRPAGERVVTILRINYDSSRGPLVDPQST